MKTVPKECEETLAKVNDRVLEWTRRRLCAYENGKGISVFVELMRKASKKNPTPVPWKTIWVASRLTSEQANAVLIALYNFCSEERKLVAERRKVADDKNTENKR